MAAPTRLRSLRTPEYTCHVQANANPHQATPQHRHAADMNQLLREPTLDVPATMHERRAVSVSHTGRPAASMMARLPLDCDKPDIIWPILNHKQLRFTTWQQRQLVYARTQRSLLSRRHISRTHHEPQGEGAGPAGGVRVRVPQHRVVGRVDIEVTVGGELHPANRLAR
jgi:hypothetical protein